MSDELHPFYRLMASLALGLLVGLQRQWVEAPLGGIRTFALISVFGALCAILAGAFGAWIILGGMLGVIAVIVVGNFSPKKSFDTEKHSVLSTEVAMLVMYTVGVMTGHGPLWLAAAAAGVLAVVLQLKGELHLLAGRFTEKEIQAFMQFVLISLIILPAVPDRTMGPLNVINPREVWLMVILIVGIGLAGYIIYKFFGARAGTWLGGFLGGLISSTATTASYARKCKEFPQEVARSAVVVSLAWTVAYVRLMLEVLIAAPQFSNVILPLLVLTGVSLLASLILWKRGRPSLKGMPLQENPSELKAAVVFGFLFAAILLVVAAAKEYLGDRGLLAAGFISGITDLDAITLSTGRLVQAGKILSREGTAVILVAVLANLIFKQALVGILCGRKLMKAMLLPFISSAGAAIALLLFWRGGG